MKRTRKPYTKLFWIIAAVVLIALCGTKTQDTPAELTAENQIAAESTAAFEQEFVAGSRASVTAETAAASGSRPCCAETRR